jgi:phosphoribosylanthranilate isomerase
MWIKICGMTTPEAVAAALDAGVDAIGFVFATSVRQVTPAQALRLAAPARGRILCVAVTRHPSQPDVDRILQEFGPDILQTDSTDLPSLRLPSELELLPVVRDGSPLGIPSLTARSQEEDDELPRRLLFEGAASGAGKACDWSAAQRLARRAQLVLAGGLNPNNVASAIAQVQPFGVDVSTGVEARPGVKSPAEIAHFVTVARASSRAHEDLV